MKSRILIVFICLAASTIVACRASTGMVRAGVFQTQDAQALAPSARATMEQPDRTLLPFKTDIWVDLQDLDSTSNDKWYKTYPGFVKPSRIEVAPGIHRFYYSGPSLREDCFFGVAMLPGHVYKPINYGSAIVYSGNCIGFAVSLLVLDTAPDGKRVTITVGCE